MSLKERAIEARKSAGIGSQSDLARRCGVDSTAINKIERGQTLSLSGDLLVSIVRETGVSALWLTEGRGPKYPDPKTPQQPTASQDPFIAAILSDLAKARTPEERQAFERHLLAESARWLLERHDKTRPPPAIPAPKEQAS